MNVFDQNTIIFQICRSQSKKTKSFKFTSKSKEKREKSREKEVTEKKKEKEKKIDKKYEKEKTKRVKNSVEEIIDIAGRFTKITLESFSSYFIYFYKRIGYNYL